jgi:DNA-binding CsgD family transcriptional regulator
MGQPSAQRMVGNSKLPMLVRESPLPTWLLSPETRTIVEVSDAVTTLLGARRDQLLQRDATDFVVNQAVARSRVGLLATGEIDSYRVQAQTFRRLDGTQFDVDASLSAYTDETARRLAIGVLLPVAEPLLPISGVPDTPDQVALGTVDEDWRIDRISAGVEQLLGYAAADLVGRPISILVEPADWPNLLITIGHGLLPGPEGATTLLLLRGADGQPRCCRALVARLAGASAPSFAFSFALVVQPVLNLTDRAWALEGHIRRIAREVAASGALAGLTASPTTPTLPAMAGLSTRELEIVTGLLAGERVPMIAERMFLSQSTVRNHLTSVYRKLGVRSQQQLIRLLRVQAGTDLGTGDFA